MSTVLEDETYEKMNEALRLADELCTHVVAGKPGQMQAALRFASAFGELKRTQHTRAGSQVK